MLLCFASSLLYSQGFDAVTTLTPFPVTKNSGERTQSKVWQYDGKWWSVFPNDTGTYVWRLDGTSWTPQLKISSSSMTKADCKPLDNLCHILLWREYGYESYLISVQYDPAARNYVLWTQRPERTAVTLDEGVETGTIDIDATGRMWLASDGITDIRVRWSDPPYLSWSAPIIVASGLSDDDIGTVIALPQQQIGVFWSNQVTQRFGFKIHNDGASPAAWSADEVPGSQSALNIKGGMADDHLDLGVTSNGVLYCAFKTGYDTPGYPKIALLRRQQSGTWDAAYEVSDIGTKPLLIINEAADKLKVVFPSESGSDILYKESSLSWISFSPMQSLLAGNYDNPTSAKDNYAGGVVVLASDNLNKQIVGVLATEAAATIPAPPALVSPANAAMQSERSIALSWEYSELATEYRVQVTQRSDFSTLFLDKSGLHTNSLEVAGLSDGATYYWRVRAANSRGASAWSAAWSFTVYLPDVVPGLAGHWKLDEGTGASIHDSSGNDNSGQTIASPLWTAGIEGSALAFDGSAQYATIADADALDVKEQVTLSAWIRPEKLASQKIIIKGDSKISDGYELALLSTGKVTIRINQYTSDICKINSGALYPTTGDWMHVAGTFDGTRIKIYINGVKDKELAFDQPASIGTNNMPLQIGASVDETSMFKGAIDDVRVYSYALTEAEVYDMAQQGDRTSGSARLAESGVAPASGAEEPSDGIEVFPNPAERTLFVRFESPSNRSISISDAYGNVLFNTAAFGNSDQLEIPVDALQPGLYILSVRSAESRVIKKFLKK